jgi:hypothetical protein
MRACWPEYLKAKEGVADPAKLAKIDDDYDRCAKQNADATKKAGKKAKKEGVRIGMTEAEVLASSWGAPEKKNNTHTKHGTRSQWVYGLRHYLYFENGILTTIQN